MVTSAKQYSGQEMTVTRIVRGVLEVESFYQTTTTWDVRGPVQDKGFKVLIRQPQTGSSYELAERPEGTEDLEDAWLIPIVVAPKQNSASIKVVEQTPSKISLAIWDQQALALLEKFLMADNLRHDIHEEAGHNQNAQRDEDDRVDEPMAPAYPAHCIHCAPPAQRPLQPAGGLCDCALPGRHAHA